MGVSIAREEGPAASRRLLEALTVRLSDWFAQLESNRHYAEQVEMLEGRVARAFYERLGFELVLSRHPLAYYLKSL
jgi:hypothetical protein